MNAAMTLTDRLWAEAERLERARRSQVEYHHRMRGGTPDPDPPRWGDPTAALLAEAAERIDALDRFIDG